MKACKLEVLIINHDKLDIDNIKEVLENGNYPNDCISPEVINITEVEIGEWTDDHPLNQKDKCDQEYNRLFKREILENILNEIEKFDSRIYDVFFNADKERFDELEQKLLSYIT